MRLLKLFGAIMLVLSVVSLVANFFYHLPALGVFGSFIFNPFGLLFADGLAKGLIANAGSAAWILGLAQGSVAWTIGGVLAVLYSLALFFVGAFLVRR